MNPLRILAADDHEIVRRGLVSLLKSHAGWDVCGEARDGREAVEKAKELRPDIVILDIGMPNLNGLEAARQMLHNNPQSRLLILTITDVDEVVRAVLDAPRPRSGRPTCWAQDFRRPRESRPSRRTLGRHVSRQVLVELRSHNSSGLLVDRCPTLAWVQSTFLSWFNLDCPNPRNGGLCLRWSRLHSWGMERACRPQARRDDPHQPGDHSCFWYVARCNIRPL
jgi:CheY-like chemotaxis protein